MALAVKYRLKKELDFKKILKTGRAVRGAFLFVKFISSNSAPRFGISVPAKIFKKATIRNRIKRFLSENIRIHILPKAGGYDTVVMVTKNGLKDPVALQQDLLQVFRKAGII
jgi:ribonuclease P protein component